MGRFTSHLHRGWIALAIVFGLGAGIAVAQVPGEVQQLGFDGPSDLSWQSSAGAERYHVYRGDLSGLRSGVPPRCHGFDLPGTSFTSDGSPVAGEAFVYLATAASDAGEGTPGDSSAGAERALLGRCLTSMRAHVFDRAGYGWSEWAADRVASLGLQGYLDEQLDPASILEDDNMPLKDRLTLYDPPNDIVELIARQFVTAVFARRQLEQQVAMFWNNHFNTFWAKLQELYATAYPECQSDGVPQQCDPNYPEVSMFEATSAQFRESEAFRDLAFNGNFRQILEASAKSPAMILFLDTFSNIAVAPNENYSRELLELYTMGVDGGYTQTDVEELARVLTGWTICKKKLALTQDPLAVCIEQYWLPSPQGEWVANFVPANHDCGQKVLFSGTPQELVIPESCGDSAGGVNDLTLALDRIAGHPSTAEFISRKILERLVTDQPDQTMIDAMVAEWNDAGNPAGLGDLRELLRTALTLGAFLDPDRVGSKIKTPFEHAASGFRALRGTTDGQIGVLDFLVRAQHIPHYNPVPTGWPERGDRWLDTTNTLERQNFGILIPAAAVPPGIDFGSDPIALLQSNGVSTAPGNAEAIVDFLGEVMFGGRLTPAERQTAIDVLNSDEAGSPSPYDDTRIRYAAGFLLGYPQFQEQ